MPDIIEVDMETCIESYPCQHYVLINGIGEEMGARKIIKLLIDNGLEVPKHFREYIN